MFHILKLKDKDYLYSFAADKMELKKEIEELKNFRDTVMNGNYLSRLIGEHLEKGRLLDKSVEKALGMKLRKFHELYDKIKDEEANILKNLA